ncbi:bifunctional folylpolyglutamate synthase/dihydrofolate synthase [Algoriphagus zhangzhouensis]|uniref:Dihydrofolate synthase/folylpolyglutamate synthase n=1 Tax=Algoriphagus zhangzhouensis TaxID=1073327 RepID=A0A1M7Z6F6_9BACT|nr:folylpolyglutamate synthase/dihydrofolate synthase family protein [Algoriphagus zhangzhouensis]TDY49054.1 dihydrofolate synthase/folylpolyglutamate synthase [Algoriphagus zhangzhouensis]SHO60360.1 dihydrofolate synthase / folylpolyglutamate synthase [Algoriphagus zhangzhouensis]
MTYQETLDYLFNALPMFQRVGASALKKDLSNTIALCNHLGNPEKKFKSVHVAGTNGKGSSSHSIASVLQAAGFKTGLYTSPHLKSFTERIRINGLEIPEDAVVEFVEENKSFLEELKPSFFEMTVGMAFWYFAKEQVDIAVVEVGMGGRLDSTNVLMPEVSLITNIGMDHVQFLGDTLAAIAGEKAGIIKKNIPVVISKTQEETTPVFVQVSKEQDAPITFADQKWKVEKVEENEGKALYDVISSDVKQELGFDLLGNYQKFNLPGILETLVQLKAKGWDISSDAIKAGLTNVTKSTGLKGRWQVLSKGPLTICDTGHNEAGIQEILNQLESYSYDQLWMVLGMVQDKDISKILQLLPKTASYIFCQAKLPRAMKAEELLEKAKLNGLEGTFVPDVNEALNFARKKAGANDLIFVGGSTFVVAEIEEL